MAEDHALCLQLSCFVCAVGSLHDLSARDFCWRIEVVVSSNIASNSGLGMIKFLILLGVNDLCNDQLSHTVGCFGHSHANHPAT